MFVFVPVKYNKYLLIFLIALFFTILHILIVIFFLPRGALTDKEDLIND